MMTLLREIWSDKKKRAGIIIVLLLFIGLAILNILANTPTGKIPRQQVLPLSPASFAQISGDSLYYFDGLSFQKINLGTQAHTTLSTPAHLPDINSVWWLGDKGVLATFSGSLDNTAAEKYVYQYNLLGYNEHDLSHSFLWYLDFASGEITMVKSQYVDDYHVFYDPTSGKAYVVVENADIQESITDENSFPKIQLQSFDTSLRKFDADYSAGELAHINSVSSCPDAPFCVIGSSDGKNTILTKFDGKSLVELAKTNYGSIVPTNQPDKYMFLEPPLSDAKMATLNDDDSVTGPFSLRLYSVGSKSFRDMNFDVPENMNVVPYLTKSEDSILYNDSGSAVTMLRSKNRLGFTINKTIVDKSVSTAINGNPSFTTNAQYTLVQTLDDHYLLIGGDTQFTAIKGVVGSNEVNSCINADESFSYNQENNLFDITVLYSDTLQTRIGEIGACVYKTNPSTATMFNILVMSPTTGQIISN